MAFDSIVSEFPFAVSQSHGRSSYGYSRITRFDLQIEGMKSIDARYTPEAERSYAKSGRPNTSAVRTLERQNQHDIVKVRTDQSVTLQSFEDLYLAPRQDSGVRMHSLPPIELVQTSHAAIEKYPYDQIAESPSAILARRKEAESGTRTRRDLRQKDETNMHELPVEDRTTAGRCDSPRRTTVAFETRKHGLHDLAYASQDGDDANTCVTTSGSIVCRNRGLISGAGEQHTEGRLQQVLCVPASKRSISQRPSVHTMIGLRVSCRIHGTIARGGRHSRSCGSYLPFDVDPRWCLFLFHCALSSCTVSDPNAKSKKQLRPRSAQQTQSVVRQECRVCHNPEQQQKAHSQRAELPVRVKIVVIASVGRDGVCNLDNTDTCQEPVRRLEP
nr:hypothetical protein CFP56_72120 [Quercus suber]